MAVVQVWAMVLVLVQVKARAQVQDWHRYRKFHLLLLNLPN